MTAVRSASIKATRRSAVFAASPAICTSISSGGGDPSASACAVSGDSDPEQATPEVDGLQEIDWVDDILAERDCISITAPRTRQAINRFSAPKPSSRAISVGALLSG